MGKKEKEEGEVGRFLAWKKVLDCNNLLNESIQIEFPHSVFLLVVERLSLFSKRKWTDDGYNDQIWLFSMVYHTAYLQKEHLTPFFAFLS